MKFTITISASAIALLVLAAFMLACRGAQAVDPASRVLPPIPPPGDRLPRPQDLTSTGECKVTPHVVEGRLPQELDESFDPPFTVIARFSCSPFLPVQACPDGTAWPIAGITQVCDENVIPVRHQGWTAVTGGSSPDYACESDVPAVFDGELLAGGYICGYPYDLEEDHVLSIEICFSIRLRESCGRFQFSMSMLR
jgi:hypothetical protein